MIRYLRTLCCLAVYCLFARFAPGQEIGIGEWREHLPYSNGVSVAHGSNNIYCATSYSLFYLDKDDNSLVRLNKITGLSDLGISCIAFDNDHQTLLVAYQNSNIDLIRNNKVINVSDIKRSTAVTPGEKVIHAILIRDHHVYFSCGFGIVVMDLDKTEISDTWFIGPQGSHLAVLDLTYNDTAYFAATENGIYSASLSSGNLAYYESWKKDSGIFFPDALYSQVEAFSGKIFANKQSTEFINDTILYYDGAQWHYTSFENSDAYSIRALDGRLYVCYNYAMDVYDESLTRLYRTWTYNPGDPQPRDVTVDNGGKVWIADYANGLVRMDGEFSYQILYPNGPKTELVYAMSAEGGMLWAVPGGKNSTWGNIYTPAMVSSFINGSWKTYTYQDVPALDTLRDILSVAIDPSDPLRVFAGSWSRGLLEFYNGEFQRIYGPGNSSLEYNVVEGKPVVKVGGLAFDANGYLWASNSAANNVLSVRMPGGSPEGTWKSFNLGSQTFAKDIGAVLVDDAGQKWMLTREEHALFVFSDNGTITNTGDDQVKKLTASLGQGNLPGVKVYSFAQDHDGELWLGTDEGIGVIYTPENVFTGGDYDAQRILVPRNDGTNNADILFETETVTAIAIDGSNRKWIGTDKSGVYLISDDGLTEIHHFTEDNSPLLSNSLTSIAINHLNGEVFFGTAKGIISYKGTATAGGEQNTDVYAYPNPVRPGFEGPIAIKGLVNNAWFKVTDVAGTLVYEGRAEGGQAIWYGKTLDGKAVQTGVYLVFATNDDGAETVVTKILFVR